MRDRLPAFADGDPATVVAELLALAWPGRADTVEEVLAVDRAARARVLEMLP